MSIPVLGVAILNQPELLDRLMASIDHPVDRLVVIDNGDVIDPFIGGHRMTPYRAHVVKPGHNLGCAESWNLIIRANPLAPYWVITNHDIEFGPGDLARLEAAIEPRAAIVYHLLGFAAFAITPPAIHAAGWFDGGFINGYDEDVDYSRRCELAGVRRVEVGFSGSHVGSATIHSDPDLRRWNGISHGANDAYYREKWGGDKLGGETFSTPWNSGRIQDTRPDINRLRDFTWPREKA